MFSSLKILKIWTETMFTFVKLLVDSDFRRKGQSGYVQQVASNDEMIEIFSKILIIQLPTDKQLKECIISTSSIEDFDNIANEVKTLVLKCINKILTFIIERKSILNTLQNKFYKFIKGDGIKGLLQSVFTFCKTNTFSIEEAIEVIIQNK